MSTARQIKRGNLKVIQQSIEPYISVVRPVTVNNRMRTRGRKKRTVTTLRKTLDYFEVLISGSVVARRTVHELESFNKRMKFKPFFKYVIFKEKSTEEKIKLILSM